MEPQFNSVLVANRGEIALRIMRTARSEGYRVIAVYSEADAASPHVAFADQALCIGPAPANQSYLHIDRILEAARESGAQAVHPGYGFLSENPVFATACRSAGLVFIGPSASAIELMGNKAAAKREMRSAGVPCVPGFEGDEGDDRALIKAATDIGFPLMVKAAAGGGGRGMVLVESAQALPQALSSARSVALSSFGSEEVILEKAIICPRHVEIQVFADSQGNVIHLGERDCSVQRRHQKVVEEAPCTVVDEALREHMGRAAVEAAAAIGYCGAGTVEFLLDENGDFYFLEMNTRLQVEHPVTELVTGLDLVALQLQVARGAPLGISQHDVRIDGHAIEVRLYAEEPTKEFLPRTGVVTRWQPSASARVDAGIDTGYEISPFYDSMLAKVVVHGETREQARKKMLAALADTVLFGVVNNRDFLIQLLHHRVFSRGEAKTDFIPRYYGQNDWPRAEAAALLKPVAAVLLCIVARNKAQSDAVQVASPLLNWTSGPALLSHYQFDQEALQVSPIPGDHFEVMHGDAMLELSVLTLGDGTATVTLAGRQYTVYFWVSAPGDIELSVNGCQGRFCNELLRVEAADAAAGSGRILAPMHGVVLELLVTEGERLTSGQRVAVVEAMKMQHDVLADSDGVVSQLLATPGAQVSAQDLLLVIEQE